tara:strand:- start:2577 stop:2735 length:159 start_codon:yes stop_codon:yes gene_type:complete
METYKLMLSWFIEVDVHQIKKTKKSSQYKPRLHIFEMSKLTVVNRNKNNGTF